MYLIIYAFLIIAQQILINAQLNSNITKGNGAEITCQDDSWVTIDGIVVTAENTLLIFIYPNKTAMTTIGANDTKYPVLRYFNETSNLLELFSGRIATAFTIGNYTYVLNDGLEMWTYDANERNFSGPELRTNKFKCLKKDYQIDSVLVIHPTHKNPHVFVFYSEKGLRYLTSCNINTGQILKKDRLQEEIGAIELLWKLDEYNYEGVAATNYFFSRFIISPFSRNLNYVKVNGPIDDNQLLLGCPQNLCYNGEVDAIVSTPMGVTYVFRGIYLWNISTEALTNTGFSVKDAQLISDVWPDLPNDLDAAYYDREIIHFFKNGYVFEYDIRKNRSSLFKIEEKFNGLDFTDSFDTVWFDKQNNELYFIKDYQYIIYDTVHKHVSKRGDIVIELANSTDYYSQPKISAIFSYINDTVFIVMRDYAFITKFASLKRKTFRDPILLQQYFFLCKTNYKYALTPHGSFAGFQRSMSKFRPLSISFNDNKTTMGTMEHYSHKNRTLMTTTKELLTEEDINNWRNGINQLIDTKAKPRWIGITMFFVVPVFFVACVVAAILIIKQSRALRK